MKKFFLHSLCLLAISVFSPALLPYMSAQQQYRTVIDKEMGSFFQNPGVLPYSDYGMFVGSPKSLDVGAIRVLYAQFQQFSPDQDSQVRGFPYSQLRTYETQQRAAGKTPLFVTATYAGKSRPVLFSWTLKLVNGKPTAPSSQWQSVLNVQDPRFVHFWLNHYIQPLMSKYQYLSGFGPNLAFELDQCTFIQSLYGVLDDNNNFIANVTWDSPFPQNQTAYEAGIESFFTQVKRLAPNLVLLPNIGSQGNPAHFPQLFANVAGGLTENIMGWYPHPSGGVRAQWYTGAFQYFSWLGSQGKMGNLRAVIASNDSNALHSAFVVYSLLKGTNFFFAPGDSLGNSTNPTQWSNAAALLGDPTSALQVSSAMPAGNGYRLFSRSYQGGVIYLNWTGVSQTVRCPVAQCYDPAGNAVTQVTIPDGLGTYMTTVKQPLYVSKPLISPLYQSSVIGPVSVTIGSTNPATIVRYTLDGSVPTTASPVYAGPLQISSSTVVHARAFYQNEASGSSAASYTLSTLTVPDVQFAVTADSGLQGSYYPVVSLTEVPRSPVTITYSVQNGTPSTGRYTFLTGMGYGVLPITTGSSGTTTVTITGVTGALIGSAKTLQYTIVH